MHRGDNPFRIDAHEAPDYRSMDMEVVSNPAEAGSGRNEAFRDYESYRDSLDMEEDMPSLASSSNAIDPEFLTAMPPHIRADIIRQHQREETTTSRTTTSRRTGAAAAVVETRAAAVAAAAAAAAASVHGARDFFILYEGGIWTSDTFYERNEFLKLLRVRAETYEDLVAAVQLQYSSLSRWNDRTIIGLIPPDEEDGELRVVFEEVEEWDRRLRRVSASPYRPF